MTKSEIILWTRLRRSQLGYRFNRQRPIGPYIADFYCPQLKLVVEVDGLSHLEKRRSDAIRDEYMRQIGIEVVRFTDLKVLNDEETVVTEIQRALENRCQELRQ